MTRLHPLAVLGVLTACAGVAVAWSAHRSAAAHSAALDAGRTLQTLHADATEVMRLRARGQQQRVAERKPPEQDLVARLHTVMQAADLPTSEHLKTIRPESDAAVSHQTSGSPDLRRQTVSVALDRLTLPQVGLFLLRWRDTQPTWSIGRIDLTHCREKTDADRYDLTLSLSAYYVAPAPAPGPGPGSDAAPGAGPSS